MLDVLRSIPVGALRRRQQRSPHPSPLVAPDLPPEILREIFLYCIPPGEWGSLSACDVPWLLLKVCCSWRGVAMSTPELWSVLPFLRMSPKLRGGHLQLFKLYLEYSASTPLSMGFELPRYRDGAPSLPLITPYLSQSQRLSIVYFNDVPYLDYFITYMHFPLLKSLELFPQPQGQRTERRLEDIKFPWTQLTQLTIQFHNTTEALTLLGHCSSLEMLRLTSGQCDTRPETPHTPPESNIVHHRLRTISFEDDSLTSLFVGLLGCLTTPALSTLKFILFKSDCSIEHHTMQSILSFIRNSSAELISLTLRGVRCFSQDLTDLSTLIPTVTELDLYEIGGDSLQLLTIKPDSPHNVLFPCLERLVIRYHSTYFDPKQVSDRSDMFHSRLYLAPNTTTIENVSPLQHAELHLVLLADCGLLEFDGLDIFSRHTPQRLIRSLRCIYLRTVGFNREVDIGRGGELSFPSPGLTWRDHQTRNRQESVKKQIYQINRSAFPVQDELGYWAGRLPTTEITYFFRKLDAAFAALEGYRITHPLEILVNQADRLMHEFSCLPETAFLHNPAYKFHIRAAHLLKRWQPMICEFEARDRWTCKYDSVSEVYKLVHRRAVDM